MKFHLPFLHKKSSTGQSSSSCFTTPSTPPPRPPSKAHSVSPPPRRGESAKATHRRMKHPATAASSFKGLSSSHVRELEEAFKVFDENHDGKISAKELGSVLRSLGDNPTEQEVTDMAREVDKDGDGFIDLEEFLILHSSTGGVSKIREELRGAFRMFDEDKNGLISAGELHGVLKRLGRKCSVEDCKKMIKGVDEDGDGHVSFGEFQKMMA